MTHTLYALLLILLVGSELAAQNTEWSLAFGDAGDQAARGLYELENGDVLVLVGELPNPQVLNYQAYFYLLDEAGQLRESHRLPHFTSQNPQHLLARNDDSFVVGGAAIQFSGNEFPYLMEVDRRGNARWMMFADSLFAAHNLYAGQVKDIDPLPNGGYLVTGLGIELGFPSVQHDCLIRVGPTGEAEAMWVGTVGAGAFPEASTVLSDSTALLIGNAADQEGEERYGYISRVNIYTGERQQKRYTTSEGSYRFWDIDRDEMGATLVSGVHYRTEQTAGILTLKVNEDLEGAVPNTRALTNWSVAVGSDLLPLPNGEWLLAGTASGGLPPEARTNEGIIATAPASGEITFLETFAEDNTQGSYLSGAIPGRDRDYILACGTSLHWSDPNRNNEAWVLKIACRTGETVAFDEDPGIGLYPNPTTRFLNLNLTELESCLSPFADIDIRVFDGLSREIDVPFVVTQHGLRLNLEKIGAGNYFVQVLLDGRIQQALKFTKISN